MGHFWDLVRGVALAKAHRVSCISRWMGGGRKGVALGKARIGYPAYLGGWVLWWMLLGGKEEGGKGGKHRVSCISRWGVAIRVSLTRS